MALNGLQLNFFLDQEDIQEEEELDSSQDDSDQEDIQEEEELDFSQDDSVQEDIQEEEELDSSQDDSDQENISQNNYYVAYSVSDNSILGYQVNKDSVSIFLISSILGCLLCYLFFARIKSI